MGGIVNGTDRASKVSSRPPTSSLAYQDDAVAVHHLDCQVLTPNGLRPRAWPLVQEVLCNCAVLEPWEWREYGKKNGQIHDAVNQE